MQPVDDNRPHPDANAQRGAAYWLAVLSDEDCTDTERQLFLEWLRASTRHVDEFLRLSTLLRAASRPALWREQDVQALIAAARAGGNVSTLERGTERTGAEPAPRGGRKLIPLAIAASLAGLMALALATLDPVRLGNWLDPGYRTAVGEQRSITLEDGSIVELNASSHLTTRFRPELRAVELREGEAIFRVAKDAARPFRVRTGATDIVAVGTAFNVNATDARTIVTVLEGRVRVNNRVDAPVPQAAGSMPAPIELAVGEQLIVARASPVVRRSIEDTEKVTSWTDRRLIFEDTALGTAAAEFARYSPRQIRIEDPDLGARRINGVFDATDPASLVEFLRVDEELEVLSEDAGWSVRRRGER